MPRLVIFLGGNGHCGARLGPARQALARRGEPFSLVEPALPGFEGRPRAADLDAFLVSVGAALAAARATGPAGALLYGTGIGGLIALCLRGRGEHLDLPLLLQAPVLWGLERRLMPRLLRLGLARLLLRRLFGWRWFQAWFARKQFLRPLAPALREEFFQGYDRCGAAADFFDWLTPALLRKLEGDLARRPEALDRVRCWWGERDCVVSLRELAWTRAALKVDWPVRAFPTWGHYPMLDDPDGWVEALRDELATVEALP